MNKTWMIVIGCVAGLALIVSAVGIFFLFRSQTAPAAFSGNRLFSYGRSNDEYGRGNGMGMGMMNGGRGAKNENYSGLELQTYYFDALAEKFGITSADLQTKLQNGTSLLDLAAEQELTVKEYQSAVDSARTAAIDKALADGVISQNQADQLKSTSNGTGLFGMGRGFGWCY